MRIEIHVYHHFHGSCDDPVLKAINQLARDTNDMSEKLQQAVADLIAEAQDTSGKLASIKTFIEGVPALVGTAVAEALANADVASDAAAAAVEEATSTISAATDAALEAISANPAEGEEEP